MHLEPVLHDAVLPHRDVAAGALLDAKHAVGVGLVDAKIQPQRVAAMGAKPDIGQPVRAVDAAHLQREMVQRRPVSITRVHPGRKQRDVVIEGRQ